MITIETNTVYWIKEISVKRNQRKRKRKKR